MEKFISIRHGIILALTVLLALTAPAPALPQTSPASIVFTSLNVNQSFPEVSVQVMVLDAENNPVSNLTPDRFSLLEDGIPIQVESVTTASLPLDLRVVFVIDELAIGSNMPFVREAVQSFASDRMRENDSVAVLAAANGNVTQVIVPSTNDPEEVVNGVQNYDPASAVSTDLFAAVNQGLDDLAVINENTAGLNKVVVFSVSILDQLDLGETILKANELSIPVHTVLLGSQDSNNALGRLTRETNAGAGVIELNDIDDLQTALDPSRNEDQYLIVYRSRVNSPGDHEVVLEVGNALSKSASFTLDELDAPEVRITTPTAGEKIVRAETLFSQTSNSVEPTEQTVAVEISWPDGHPRNIVQERTVLVVNGRSLGPAQTVRDNGKDPVILEFVWDLTTEQTPGVSEISIVVEVEDELGLKGRSNPLPVAVEYVDFGESNLSLVIPLSSLTVALIALALVVVYMRRNPKMQEKVKKSLGTMMTRIGGSEKLATRIVTEADSAKATLILMEGNPGRDQTHFPINATTTIGRSGEHAQLVLQGEKSNSPISRLHCTILEKDGVFELRDESSANGTFINEVRLPQGKPRTLNSGDIIELARVRDGGIKFRFEAMEKPKPLKTRIVAPEQKEAEDRIKPEGYTPTLPPIPKEKPENKVDSDGYTPTLPPISKKESEDK